MSKCPCPSCDRILNTLQGKRQHHTKVHDEPLPNRECKGCGTEFYDEKAQLKFCDSCNPREGENNPNFRDAKKETKCNSCKKQFSYYPSDKKGLYCSECQSESVVANNLKDGHKFQSGSENPNWKGGKKNIICDYCDTEFERRVGRIRDSIRNFCSPRCNIEWMRSNDNMNMEKIMNTNRCEDTKDRWLEVRENVLERDNYTCQICKGNKSSFNNVHHLIPRYLFDNEINAHYEKNCITLCTSCHTTVENGKKIIPEDIISEKELEEPMYEKYTRNSG